MEGIHPWLFTLQILAFIYLGGTAAYLFFFALAGRMRRKVVLQEESLKRFITVIFPAFREDQIIRDAIQYTLRQDYPRFRIMLVADSFQEETLNDLLQLPISIVEARFDISTKVKSLKLAIQHLPPETEIVAVMDADNLPGPGFLQTLNNAFSTSFQVVQCHRMAKNINTSVALLDGISEEINNHIFRQGHRAVGLSSALIGSAMAFDVSVFRRYIPELNAVAGFDKQLELELLRNRLRIEYLPDAHVMDEKVQNTHVFYNQRKRWIYAQLFYFGEDFLRAIFHLIFKGNLDYFNKTIQYSLPPRVVLLGLLVVINLIDLFLPNPVFDWLWLTSLLLNIAALAISVPRRYYSIRTLKAIFELPRIFILMVLILFRLKGTNKQFIHTEHTYSNDKNAPHENRH